MLPDAALLETLSRTELRDIVGVLVSEARRLHSDNAALRAEADAQQAAITTARVAMQALRALLTSSCLARRPNTDWPSSPASMWRVFLPRRAYDSMLAARSVSLRAPSSSR